MDNTTVNLTEITKELEADLNYLPTYRKMARQHSLAQAKKEIQENTAAS